MAVYEGARPRTIALPARDRGSPRRPTPRAPARPRRRPRRPPDEPARPRPRGHRRRVHARLLLARPAGPRVGDGPRHRPPRARAPAPRGHRGRRSARTSTGSAASRRSASRASTPGSASWPNRSSCRPQLGDRPTDAGPHRFAPPPPRSCSSSSSSGRWRSIARLGVLAGRRPRAAGRRGAGPDDGHPRDAEQARRHLRPDRDGRAGHDRPARAPRRGARPADPGAAPSRPSPS